MLQVASSVTALAVGYLCQNPDLIGKLGIECQLRRYVVLAWLAKYIYKSASGVFGILHRKPPHSLFDEIARFEWSSERDAELVARVQTAVEELRALQTTEVPLTSDQTDEYHTLFNEMKSSYDGFTKWHDLGFQGQNPATDFRGAGKLGVLLFHGFCTKHPRELLKIIKESRTDTEQASDKPWYPLALVSIRLTNSLCQLLKRERLLVAKLLLSNSREWLQIVQLTHDRLMFAFHEQWISDEQRGKVKTYLDNEYVLKEFEQSLPLEVLNIEI